MKTFHLPGIQHCCQPAAFALAACVAGVAWQAAAAPELEPRVMTEVGLGMALTLNLIQNETNVIDNFNTSPPACTKLPSAGSIKTLSVTEVSATEYKSVIDTYYSATCTKPYSKASVTVKFAAATTTVSIAETASFLLPNGKPNGTLRITDTYSIANNVATLRGLGNFTPVGGQPAADLGFTCSIPTTGNTLTADCQGGVAQTFSSLKLSIASVVPFTLTAANNTASPSVKFKGTTSVVETGKAGSLSITAPSISKLEIAGGGTAYTATAVAGSEDKFTLFPPPPTLWTVNDTKNGARFSYSLVNKTTHAARATVTTVSTGKPLANITLDWSGSGKVTYSDGSSAVVRNYLAAD